MINQNNRTIAVMQSRILNNERIIAMGFGLNFDAATASATRNCAPPPLALPAPVGTAVMDPSAAVAGIAPAMKSKSFNARRAKGPRRTNAQTAAAHAATFAAAQAATEDQLWAVRAARAALHAQTEAGAHKDAASSETAWEAASEAASDFSAWTAEAPQEAEEAAEGAEDGTDAACDASTLLEQLGMEAVHEDADDHASWCW